MNRGLRLAFRRTVAAGAGSLALVTLGGYGSEGCRTPTQVTIELRTIGALPCASLRGVAIVVARTPQDAEEKLRQRVLSAEVPRGVCEGDGRTLGTLVITPSAGTGAVIVAARFSDDPAASCEAPAYKGCIVARRSFSFIEHASVTLPISLEVACVDVPCDVVSSCRSGTCVPSDAQCSESSGMCESNAEPVLLPDGGVSPPDGALPDGAVSDAPLGDAPADAPTDSPADGALDVVEAGTNYGNLCPRAAVAGGPADCQPLAGTTTCCRNSSGSGYFCGMPGTTCQAADDKFFCTGRKPCNIAAGQFCCGSDPATPPRSSTCSSSCTTGGDHFLCNTADDCPASKQFCTGIYNSMGAGGPLRECSVTP